MTGLRKQRTNTFWRAPPSVATDVAVREVPPADGFGVFDRDYFTNDLVMEQQLPKKSIVGGYSVVHVRRRRSWKVLFWDFSWASLCGALH